LTAIAGLPHRQRRKFILGEGYPLFPIKETAVCRKL